MQFDDIAQESPWVWRFEVLANDIYGGGVG